MYSRSGNLVWQKSSDLPVGLDGNVLPEGCGLLPVRCAQLRSQLNDLGWTKGAFLDLSFLLCGLQFEQVEDLQGTFLRPSPHPYSSERGPCIMWLFGDWPHGGAVISVEQLPYLHCYSKKKKKKICLFDPLIGLYNISFLFFIGNFLKLEITDMLNMVNLKIAYVFYSQPFCAPRLENVHWQSETFICWLKN